MEADTLQDLLTLNLTDNPQYVATSTSTTALASDKAPFICPLSLKEMNGAIPFIALRNCGCVFSDNAIRSVVPNLSRGTAASAVISDDKAEQAKPIVEAQHKVACPNCTKEFDPTPANSILPINPSKNVQDALMDQLLISRAAAKSSKKRKAAVVDSAVDGVQKVNGDGVVDGDIPKKVAKKSEAPHRSTASAASNSTADGKSTLHRSVHQKLAEQEQKRLAGQAGMSDAVKAMFKPKEEEKRGGAAEFFGRTFNRVSLSEAASRCSVMLVKVTNKLTTINLSTPSDEQGYCQPFTFLGEAACFTIMSCILPTTSITFCIITVVMIHAGSRSPHAGWSVHLERQNL